MDLFQTNNIYCHRGLWELEEEQNTVQSFLRAKENFFSIETDLRIHDGKITVSHDVILDGIFPTFESLKDLKLSAALNLKEDGLFILNEFNRDFLEISNSFVFDGSIPEMFKYNLLGFPHALRISEFEKELPWEPQYVWLDSFTSDWWLEDDTLAQLSDSGNIIVVSPELHGREPRFVWDKMWTLASDGNPNLGICTDLPLQFLNGMQ